MNIEAIAFFRSPLTSKFGIPRQSSIVKGLRGTIVFADKYAHAEALRGLDDYDYLPVSIPYSNFDFAILRVSYSDATLPLAAASSGMRTLFVLSDHSGDLSFWNDCPGDIFTKKELMNIISTAVPERE